MAVVAAAAVVVVVDFISGTLRITRSLQHAHIIRPEKGQSDKHAEKQPIS